MTNIAFIGMGEAGSAIVTGWGVGNHKVAAYDIKQEDPDTVEEVALRYRSLKLRNGSLADVFDDADLVFSTVTADQAKKAAAAVAPHLNQGAYFCDLNSCAPSSKEHSAGVIEAAGGRYVDVAVLSPVHPALNMVPMLISGPHAKAIAPILEGLPMKPRVVEGPVGRASMIKMVRSILIKGLEALTAEFMLAVQAADVADEVLPSLELNYPGFDWDGQIAYNFERAMVHGVRRAAEMEVVCKTLTDLGLPNRTTRATVDWEAALAATGATAPADPRAVGPQDIAKDLLPFFQK